nr:YjbF family lipoprotein [Halomonas sp.]
MGETLFGHRHTADVRVQAEALPYASLVARKESNRALLIMAHRTGAHGQDTFWQAGDRTTLHLRDGMPASTSGFDAVLLGRWHSSSEGQARYRVHAHWQDRDGQEWQDEALATVTCEPPAPVDMPLTRLTLERCLERLEWIGSNTTTRGKFWREPGTPWIWGGDMTLWPQGPRLQWQVARPWWSDAEETISDAGRTMPPDVGSLP